jgi:large subunit ribosomal protein L17
MPRLHIHQRLNRHPKHRWSMLRNMTASLFLHERIITTDAKAKSLIGVVGRMFSRAVKDSRWSQNKVTGLIRVKDANYKLYTDLVKRFRVSGGQICRLVHLHERRKGDCANMVMVELLKK